MGGTAELPQPFSYLDYKDVRDRNRSFSGVVASSIEYFDLTGLGKAQRIWGMVVTSNYFDVLGVRPVLGRNFLPEEEEKPGGAPYAVISYRLWQLRYGASDAVIGQKIDINRHPFTIIGVAPPLFQGSHTGLRADIWLPVSMEHELLSGGDRLAARNAAWLMVLGRLRPRATRQQAQADLVVIMQQIAAQFPDSHPARIDVKTYPLWRAPFGANGYLYVLLPMLMAIAGVVLLLTCANVANLLLVRSVARRRELAIRLSIGASRSRLVRQLLVESLLLALAGGGLAALITAWTAGLFMKFVPSSAFGVPISLGVSMDRSVLEATFAISILTGLIFGILPALRASSVAPITVLKEDSGSASGGRSKTWLSNVLVVAQLALSLLLLVCAGLFIRGFRNIQRADPGFNPSHTLLASIDLLPDGLSDEQGIQFDRQALAKIRALPGVQSASLAQWVPLGFSFSSSTFSAEGYVPQPKESLEIADALVGPDYFHTMQIPLVAGRDFTDQDSTKTQLVAVVNQAFAGRYWPDQNAIGKKLTTGASSFTVVGIARNSSGQNLQDVAAPFVYLPFFQAYYHLAIFHVRVAGDPLRNEISVEKAIHELNSDLPLFDISTLDARMDLASTGSRIAGTFVGAFGGLALLLAAVGIYGVVAYTTRRRTQEIGLRMALGANAPAIFRMVLRQGLRLTMVGIGAGLVLSLLATRFLKSALFGVAATDPLTFSAVAILLASVAMLACIIPAWRAMRVDPMVALRHE